MSGESEPQSYPYRGGSEEDDTELHCGSVSHLHHMGRASDGSDSSHDPPPFPGSQPPLHEDMEMGGNGSSGSGTESHGNESHGNESHGNESVGSSNGNGKDSALLESSGSNKSHNSQSLSPPSSSNAFSLVSSEQDHPSTSGCSSELSAKAKTQKELFKTLKELKLRLPAEKRRGGRASTLHTLRYALRCVKQVKANEEYYQMLMINDSQPPGLDMSSYTIKEINSITSEYTLKNADIFAVAVSLITGKIVYISEQASGILHCRKDEFKDRKFVEFLTPQDVSVFYSFTTPYRLPAWSMCTGAESSATEFMQEKSFFCRISGGKEKEGELQYYPFRMTPYLMKVQDSALSEEHFCCLILAERVHSGYEAPRIPPDKRIFTTTHTPNCVFQDVDERAVPLLGYLPQDLIGTPVLLHLHPSDRPLMLAVHRKILQYMGQPFDHSSIRFCTRNGEYVTIDTSWSSFVNPWSRKVSFVIGRHKVRMGPVNEDVFSAPAFTEGKIMDSDIQEITEQIHKLLLQPVHSMGSSGYGSHGSNGSHDHLLSMTSSSDSNSNGNIVIGNDNGPQEGTKAKPRSFQEICKGVQMLKTQEQQSCCTPKPDQKRSTERLKSPGGRQKDAALVVRDGPAASEELRNQTMYSYQQINCMDSVIRYLESCNIPITVKRKYQFSSNTTSSNSDEEKKGCDGVQPTQDPLSMKSSKKPQSAAVVGGALAPLALPTKAESVVSITSQCSYSSTIVHVGDKKPQPESEIIEDVAESPAPLATVSIMSPPTLEQGAYRKLGLTKQVLAAHTQKEEQAFLTRCRELCLSRLLLKAAHHSASTARNRRQSTDEAHATKPGTPAAQAASKRSGRTRKSKKLRMKKPDSSDSAVSQRRFRPPLQGLNQTSWSPSEASQSAFSLPYPTMVPGYPLYTTAPPPASTLPPGGDRNNTSSRFEETPSAQATPTAPPYSTPLVTPVVAFVLPNYMFPQLSTPPRPPCYTEPQQVYSTSQPFQHQQTVNTQQPPQPQQNYSTQPPFQTQQAYATQQLFQSKQTFNIQQPFQQQQQAYTVQQPFQPQSAYSSQTAFQPQQAYTAQQSYEPQERFSNQQSFQAQTPFTQPQAFQMQAQFTSQMPFPYRMTSDSKYVISEPNEVPSPSPALSPPLFGSHCSSPLQLDLLQLEDKPDSHSTAPPSGSQGNCSSAQEKSTAVSNSSTIAVGDVQQSYCLADQDPSDGHSSSSDLMDLLVQEDSHSGTGSATSASNGCNTSNSGTGSSNTSKYFGSVDSSENNHKEKRREDGQNLKYAVQEPLWLLMANTDDKVMMTYQVPSRNVDKVLRDDRERLRRMQKSQPRFTSDQRRELVEQHPWMRRGGLPKALNIKECLYCENDACAPVEEDLPDMELSILRGETAQEDGVSPSPANEQQPGSDSVS
ncbi:period circadian protein homolog 2-like isoform X2 [Electrophorus electricus]|uniref:period circadian protein homolog 2-like isoform X2 n=1 Tax=Electrophorus electricus TaxID=8005 RepID=UPI0015D0025F|nr:period circadian protein homolog 2-like isoform X2 [Electrophorus electricus]